MSTVSQSAKNQLERLAVELDSSKRNPMTIATFGELLSTDFFESPEELARYFGRDHAWTTKVKNVFIANGLTTEVQWWTAFKSSACRHRDPIVLPPLAPGSNVIDRTNINNIQTSSKEITQ